MGCSSLEYYSGYPFPSPGDLPDPGIEPGSPALQTDSLWSEPLQSQFSHTVVSDSVTLWTAAHQAFLSIANSRSLLKLMSIKSVIPPNHLVLCCPLLILPSVFPSIRIFSNESALRIRWSKYWSFSFSVSLSNECSGQISFRIDWFDLCAVQVTLKSLLQRHSSKA